MKENLSLYLLPVAHPFSRFVSTGQVRFETSVLFPLFQQRELVCKYSLFYTMMYAL